MIKGVYDELGGDAQVVLKWFVKDKNGVETSLLEDNYQFNLNDIEFKVGIERNYIRFKIKKREQQNKFNTRIDSTVDLFSNTNLDNNPITPVQTYELYFKKIDNSLKNEWNAQRDFTDATFINPTNQFRPVVNAVNIEFENAYENVFNPLFVASDNYKGLTLKILNLDISYRQDVNNPLDVNNFNLVYLINGALGTPQVLESSTVENLGTYNKTVINVLNTSYSIPNLNQGDVFQIFCILETESIPNNSNFTIPGNFQYELLLNNPDFAIKNNSIRLFDGVEQICKQYTDNKTTLDSDALSINGRYYNNYINSFLGLRPNVSNQTLKTNFESIFENGVSKVMALGYDLRSDKLKIEEINFFFKDIQVFDLSSRDYERESFILNQYNEIYFNTLLTGYKKFSSEQDEDLFNFNTKVELTTPIKSLKNKLDIESEIVTDEYVINESVNDSSNSTNDKDDDVILLDSVLLQSYTDSALFPNCQHRDDNGELVIEQYEKSFTESFETGDTITIITGLNQGTYTIQSLSFNIMNLGSLSPIDQGNTDNIIEITRNNVLKNRTNEGLDIVSGVNDLDTVSNLIHNPIYQLLRFYPLWGSGLTKKDLNDEIIVNDYKNNGDVSVKVNTNDFPYEYPNEITLDQNFNQTDLQNTGLLPLFTGDKIEVKIHNVDFFEFFELFNSWRYGFNNDDNTSFGYINIPTPYGNKKIYPFGDEAFNHNRGENTLTIKGLVKYGS